MYELYFDESGNTGTNFIDTRQPYFVYGGWLIEKEKTIQIQEVIKQVYQCSKAKELKSKKVAADRIKLKKMFDLLIFEIGAIPVFGVADKKYMIAAKIVETFFDHMYNHNVNGYLTYKSDLKKALADNIYTNDNLLLKFSELISAGSIELIKMQAIKDELARHFEKEKLLDVQKSIVQLTDENLLEMIEEFEFISKNGTEKRWLTLVEPVLIDRLLNVEKYANIIESKVDLYVDELQGYRDVFSELSDILSRKTLICNITFKQQCKSEDNLLIQAADLLCGFIFNTLKSDKDAEDKNVNEIWKNLFIVDSIFNRMGIKIWDYYAHNDFVYKLLSLAGYSGSRQTNNCHAIISKDFKLAINIDK